MGIVRYSVECPGCRSGVVLRLAVGLDPRQPFFYVCPQCKAATRGALLWDGGGGTDLELADGKVRDDEEGCAYTLSINPELPAMPQAQGLQDPGGSAFIMFIQMMGGRTIQFQAATAQLRTMVEHGWLPLQRLTTYYLNRDWTHFDACMDSFVDSKFSPSGEWVRDDALHKLWDKLLVPLFALDAPMYPDMKRAWNEYWVPEHEHHAALRQFARTESSTELFQNAQRDLFSSLSRYVELLGPLLPGLLCNMLPEEHQPKVDRDLRLFRDDYELIRDLYINAFESCHKALRWILGARNIHATGSPDAFPVITSKQVGALKPLKNLAAFGKLTSAEKRKWLQTIPEWDCRWDDVFDRSMRNDIGHASAHHDLASGMILRDKHPPISYTRFLARAQRSVHGLLTCASCLKILRVYASIPGAP